MSNFYVIATPIGNLEDISQRALRVLAEVDIIICEDTRVTRTLLEHYGIYTSLASYNAHDTERKEAYFCDLLKKGKNLALVSDAGTPTISDPGSRFVDRVYRTVPDVTITAIPGPSAATALMSIAGVPVNPHIFYGFLPHKKGRQTLLREIANNVYTSVVYESPHRIEKFFEEMIEHGMGERFIVIGRELTKMYEHVVRGTVLELQAYFVEHPDKVRGEFVVIVTPL